MIEISIACAILVGKCDAFYLQNKPILPWARETSSASLDDIMDSNSYAVDGGKVMGIHSPPGYEYVHSDITKLLLAPASWGESGDCPFAVDNTSLLLKTQMDKVEHMDSTKFMSSHQLAYLAEECERAVFETEFLDEQQVSCKILGLIRLSNISHEWPNPNAPTKLESNDAALLIATMVSLNLLESAIRSTIRSKKKPEKNNRGGAPLLRDMIESLSELGSNERIGDSIVDFKTLGIILRTLLLPNRLCGMNLRNLISHGFLSVIDRRWFALTVVMIQTLDNIYESTNNYQNRADTNLMKYESMAKVVSRGREIILGDNDYLETRLRSSFIPSPYLHMSEFIFTTLAISLKQGLQDDTVDSMIPKFPSLTTIYLMGASSLLEHSLRLNWCRANNKPVESIARPSKYYVTLDGHGQRDKHDIMISPLLRNGSRNMFMGEIGSASALLSDLFSAPSHEAPNIRSQLCHGAWDAEIVQELESLAHFYLHSNRNIVTPGSVLKSKHTENDIITDSACAITATYEVLVSNLLRDNEDSTMDYRPVYSYVAMLRRDLIEVIQDLTLLEKLVHNEPIVDCINKMNIKQSKVISDTLKDLGFCLDSIQQSQQVHFCEHTDYDIWFEHNINIVLSDCVAAQTLLSEVSHATNKYTSYVQQAMDVLKMRPASTKEKRSLNTTVRICGIASIVLDFYTMAVYVSLAMIQRALELRNNNFDYVKLIERTRMAFSTFENYMEQNLDRSLKALLQYLQSKALRKFISHQNHAQSHQRVSAS